MKQFDKRNLTMVMDFYELTMSNGYFREQDRDARVAFDVFYRKNPDGGGYSIFAGLEQIIEYIQDLHFDDDDIAYLREQKIFEEDFLEYLRNFKFEGDLYAFPEGTIMYPNEPVLTIVAPLIDAQLVETAVLLQVNHQSLVATKASRIVRAAQGRVVSDFGARRAHNMDAAVYGARAAYIGGVNGTATVLSGEMFGIPVGGTMAHSWVMYYEDEYTAFKKYAETYPDGTVLLIDTYDVLKSGVPNAIRIAKEVLEPMGKRLKGVRIDSGDLGYLSREATRMFTEAGFPDAIISGSNDLDEYLIQSLKEQGCTVTSWGVGTKIITADGTSALGGVFKMSAREQGDGFEPVMKISNDVSKMTNPGIKTVRRFYRKDNGKMITDLICLENEAKPDGGDFTLVTESAKWRKKYLKAGKYTCEEMLKPVMRNGEAEPLPTLKETIAYANEQMETLWPEYKRLMNPNIMEVNLSDKLQALKTQIIEDDLKNR